MAGYPIEIHHITKKYGDHTVLRDINIDIHAGEFIALVGHSGCGKSTLLRLLSNLTEKSNGHILINDKENTSIDSDVRFLFQDARLLPWCSVLENVVLGSPTRSKEQALEALASVGLEKEKDKWPADLSGGQKQRVALARALVGTPKVMLLDEPLSALDALTRLNMQQLIEELWHERGFTVILVTHDVSEAVHLADRVILLEDGKIALDKEIKLARPRYNNLDSAYYEQLILSHIMQETSANDEVNEEYAI